MGIRDVASALADLPTLLARTPTEMPWSGSATRRRRWSAAEPRARVWFALPFRLE